VTDQGLMTQRLGRGEQLVRVISKCNFAKSNNSHKNDFVGAMRAAWFEHSPWIADAGLWAKKKKNV